MSKASVEFQGLEPHTLASAVDRLYTQWESGRQPWLKRVREVIQYVYATSTRETTNVQNPWSHSTVVPKLTQIYDNLGANYAHALFGGREFFTFEPANRDEDTQKKRRAIVGYLATKHDYNGFRRVMKQLLDDWVQTGNCFCRVEYVRETEVDPVTKLPYTTYEGPRPVRISPFDIVFDPTVARFQDTPKIFREVLSRGALLRRVEDDPEGETYDLVEVERLRKMSKAVATASVRDTNKFIQFKMDGFSDAHSYFSSGNVELLHFIGDIYNPLDGTLHKSRLITIADRSYVIRNTSLDDLSGFGMIYHAGWRKRPDNLWAQGPLDNVVGMQYLINHLENARGDGYDQMLSPDRVITGSVEIEKKGPVTTYYIDDGNGSVHNLAPDGAVLQADTQIQLKEAQMEAYTGAPREAMGVRSPGEKTAFEVESLQIAAGRLFQVRIEDFETELVELVLNGELEVAVKNLDTADVARTLDPDFGVEEFSAITRDDLRARGKLKARGASHYAKRTQAVRELQGFEQVLSQDPDLRLHYPALPRAKAWDELLNLHGWNLMVPFGGMDEAAQAQKAQMATQTDVDETAAAAQGIQQGLQGQMAGGGM